MPEVIDMSTASLYSTVPLLPDFDNGYTAFTSVEFGMEGLRRVVPTSEGLEDSCNLCTMSESAMEYVEQDLYSLIKVPSQLEEGIDDRSQGNDLQIDGYHDAEHILTELTSPYRDFSPGSTGDTSFEHESSDSSGSDNVLWEGNTVPFETPLPDITTLYTRLPPPPKDDFLGTRRPITPLIKTERPELDESSLDYIIFHENRDQRRLDENNNDYDSDSEPSPSEDGVSSTTEEKIPRKKPGRKKGQVSKVLHLWEFIRDLLSDPKHCPRIISWENESEGVFRVIHSTEVARLWGEKKKNKKAMTYEKLSRSLRYSRREGYFDDLPKDKGYPKKLCFKFGPKSHGWREFRR